MTTAYLLSKEGKSVIVLDDGPIGGGMTGRTTAHLVNALDDRYFELERLHGEKGARLAAESHTAAIDRVEAIVKNEKIDCEFERLDGYLFVPPGDAKKILDDELEAALRAGLKLEKVARAPIDSYDTGSALRFPHQAQFHPLKYLAGLAQAIKQKWRQHSHRKHMPSKIEGGDRARHRNERGSVSHGRGGSCRDQLARERSVRHSHKASGLSNLCNRCPGTKRVREQGALLGHT